MKRIFASPKGVIFCMIFLSFDRVILLRFMRRSTRRITLAPENLKHVIRA